MEETATVPTVDDLCTWLRHNMGDLRLLPDVITEAEGPVVRFRWHRIAYVGGAHWGVGIDLCPGPLLGEVWMYGPGVRHVRLHAGRSVVIPPPVKATLRTILSSHLANREHDWGRGARFLGSPRLLEAGA